MIDPITSYSNSQNRPPRPLTKKEIESELHRLAPFHHAVDLPHGFQTYIPEASRQERERTRLDSLRKHAWPAILDACGGSFSGRRILDVACNCGGFSVEAAKTGADYVLGIDIDEHYIEQANFIRDALDLGKVEFRKENIEDLSPAHHGAFDVTFCFGILYHLENPIKEMRRIAEVTKEILVVDTTILFPRYIGRLMNLRWPLWHMRRVAAVEDSAKNISTSRWRTQEHCQFTPNVPAVKELLHFLGFGDVTQLKPRAQGLEPRYYEGSRVTFIARRL